MQKAFVDKGMVADVCVHDKGDGNPHCHVMLTLRPFNEDGTWAAKSKKEYILDENGERIRLPSGEYKNRKVNAVDWNEPTKAEKWRVVWEDAANAALEHHGFTEHIDHRSYERRCQEYFKYFCKCDCRNKQVNYLEMNSFKILRFSE